MTEAQQDEDLVLALLQCGDDWQKVELLRLYGHHERADQLTDQLAEELADAFLAPWLSSGKRVANLRIRTTGHEDVRTKALAMKLVERGARPV